VLTYAPAEPQRPLIRTAPSCVPKNDFPRPATAPHALLCIAASASDFQSWRNETTPGLPRRYSYLLVLVLVFVPVPVAVMVSVSVMVIVLVLVVLVYVYVEV